MLFCLFVCFFPPKVRAAMIYHRNEQGLLEMQNFTSAITYSPLTGWLLTPFPLPQSLYDSVWSYADVITKFSWMDRLPNFLSYGAPRAWSSAKIRRNYFKLFRFFKLIKQWRGEVVTSRCIIKAVISTCQAQFGDQFIHVGPSGWIWVNFRNTPPFIFGSYIVAFFRSVQNHYGGAMRSPSLPAGRVTLQSRPTFCFTRKQFTTFCKEMSLLPMTTFLHINGALGKEQLVGST